MDPDNRLVDWDFDNIKNSIKINKILEYFNNLLNKIKKIYKIKLDSQIIHYGEIGNKIIYNKKNNEFEISAREMQFILNNNDWKFDSTINYNPNIQLLLIVPHKKITPLILYDYDLKRSNFNSFIIPSWGGVKVFNINSNNKTIILNENDLKETFEIYLEQIRKLIGINHYKDKNIVIIFIF
jgi:phosphatidylinositol glycan class S